MMSSQTYTIAVVGAGMIGSSAARWVSELCPGGRVVLVGREEGGEGAWGAWYDQGRITRVFDLSYNWRTLAKESIQRYRDIEKESGLGLYDEVGYITLIDSNYTDKEGFVRTAEVLKSEGYRCEEMTKDIANTQFPYLYIPDDVWGYYQPDSAGYINPRTLVRAQQVLSTSRGCSVLRQDVIDIQRNQEGIFLLLLSSGETITAEKVILAPGAYLNLSGLMDSLLKRKISLRLTTQTVAYIRVSPEDAMRLRCMPCLVTNYPSGKLDGTYILPPIQYPDGNYYLKLGHHSNFEKEIHTKDEVDSWYKGGQGDPEAVIQLSKFLATFIPDLKVEDVSGGCCVTAKSPNKIAPYIDEATPGVIVAAAGCGYAAKSCDEIGRIAAVLCVEGRWDSSLPREDCRLQWEDGME